MTRAQLIAYITGILALTGTLVGLSLWTGSIDPETGFPDPITVDGKTIEFTWTDDNTNEDLIIYTDKATYTNGLSHAEVYIALHNNSGVKQNVSFGGYFRDTGKRVDELSVLVEVTEEFSDTTRVENCRRPKDYTTVTTATGTVQVCDVFIDQVNTWQETSLQWVPLPQEDRNQLADTASLSKTGRTQKSVEDFIADKVANYEMEIGEVVYLKALVKFPPNSEDNWYFEAVGSEGAYGHLDPWFNASWTYRQKIELNPDRVSGSSDHSSFPVYVDLSNLDSDFHTNVKEDGCDIRIVESDETTETPFELVEYASSTDSGELHFLVDTLSYNATTTFYIYYGNSGASCYGNTDTYGRNNTWPNYKIVQHMNGTTTNSTGDVTATASNVSFGTSFGKIGQGADFNGTSSKVDFSTASGVTTVTSMQWWIKSTQTTLRYPIVLERSDNASNLDLHINGVAGRGGIGFWNGTAYRQINGTTVNVRDGNPHMIVGTRNGANAALYVDGSSEGTATNFHTINVGLDRWALGYDRNAGSTYYDGSMDEVRVTTLELSADWVATEYNNQNSASSFYYFGGQETDTGGGDVSQSTVIMFE